MGCLEKNESQISHNVNFKFVSLCTIRWFKWINQPVATIPPVYYLMFIYSSTCFGRPHDHHQELSNCSSSLWFYLRSVVTALLLPSSDCNPEAATAVVEPLMMAVRTPKTCWAVNKCQVINWRDCCIWLVYLFKSHDVISISSLPPCLTAFHPLNRWQPFTSTHSFLVPTFLCKQSMLILTLWAGSFYLNYPTFPLKHHDNKEDIPTSSHTAMIYDSMYPHGIMACT
jgi:hypothetical protein